MMKENFNNIETEKAPTYRFFIMIICALSFMYFFMGLQLITAYSEEIMADININQSNISMMITCTMTSFVLSSSLAGNLSRKFGAKNMLTIGLLFTAVIIFAITTIKSYTLILVFRFLQGLFGSLIVVVSLDSYGAWFPKKQRAIAASIVTSFTAVGFAITSSLAPLLLKNGLNWREAVLWSISVPGFILAFVVFAFLKEFKKTFKNYLTIDEVIANNKLSKNKIYNNTNNDSVYENIKQKDSITWQEVTKDRRFMAGILLMFCNCWAVYGLSATLPLFLKNDLALEAEKLAVYTLVIFIAGAITTPLGGILSDTVFKSKRHPVLAIGFMLLCVSAIFVMFAPAALIPFVLFVLNGAVPLTNGPYWCIPAEISPEYSTKISGNWLLYGQISGIFVAPLLTVIANKMGNNYYSMITFAFFGFFGFLFAFMAKPKKV